MASGDITWVSVCTAMALFMTPGLALFYGGMVRAKNVLNVFMMCFSSIALGTVVWLAFGHSLAFGEGNGFIGGLEWFGLRGLRGEELLNPLLHMMFVIITPPVISGALVERMKFSAWLLFSGLWMALVYPLVARWSWAGWLEDFGAVDFAGGLVVHVNAGAAALAVIMVLGPRIGFPKTVFRPHSLPLVAAGAGILWFGWFGFNGAAAGGANDLAVKVVVATQAAGAAGVLGWTAGEFLDKRTPPKATLLGAASGAIAGMVAITPAAGYVGPGAALLFGLAAGYVCYLAVRLKYRFGWDDSLDVLGLHLVGGLLGSLLLGLFADGELNGVSGLFYGNPILLWRQTVAAAVVMAFSFAATWLIAKAVDWTVGLRAAADDEIRGLDLAMHEERGYVWGTITAERGDQ